MPGDWQGCQGKQGHGDNTVNKGSSWRLSLLSACVEDGKPMPLPRSSARTLAPAEQPQCWAPADSAWFMHWEAGGRCARSGISASLQDTVNLHTYSLYDGSCLLATARQRGFPSLQAAEFSGPLHLTVIYVFIVCGLYWVFFSCLYLIPSYYPSVGPMDDYCNRNCFRKALSRWNARFLLPSPTSLTSLRDFYWYKQSFMSTGAVREAKLPAKAINFIFRPKKPTNPPQKNTNKLCLRDYFSSGRICFCFFFFCQVCERSVLLPHVSWSVQAQVELELSSMRYASTGQVLTAASASLVLPVFSLA